VEIGVGLRYGLDMAGISSFKTTTTPGLEPALTAAEREARAASIARARAQAEAGETVPGEAVFEWLASWGTDKELPAPKPSRRRP
jgi:predicted transcriptional regulator